MSVVPSMSGTLAARTCRSGSATVMATPRPKLTIRISQSLRDLVSFAPMWLPMRVMAISAPRVNRPMPRMRRAEATTKESISPASTGTRKKQMATTMALMGRTDAAASRSFSNKMRFWYKPSPLFEDIS